MRRLAILFIAQACISFGLLMPTIGQSSAELPVRAERMEALERENARLEGLILEWAADSVVQESVPADLLREMAP